MTTTMTGCKSISWAVAGAVAASMGAGAAAGPMLGTTHDGLLVEIDRATGALTTIGPLNAGSFGVTGMAYDPAGDVLYGTNTNGQLFRVDPVTGGTTMIGAGPVPGMDALAFNPITGVLYGATNSFSSFLWTIDTATGQPTQVGSLSGAGEIRGLTFDTNGALYGMADSGNELVSINPATGAATVLLDMDNFANAGFWHAVEYDADQDRFYARQGNGPGSHNALYEINLGAGTATLIGADSLQAPGIFGMAIIPSPAGACAFGVAACALLRRRRRAI